MILMITTNTIIAVSAVTIIVVAVITIGLLVVCLGSGFAPLPGVWSFWGQCSVFRM